MSDLNGKVNGTPPDALPYQPPAFPAERDDDEEGGLFSELDFGKLWIIFRRNAFWLLLFPLATFVLGYLFLRYTKPLYQSESTLRLDVKNQSSILGFPALGSDDGSDLSGEVELIKSRLVYDAAIKLLNLSVSYYAQGKILDEERYRNSPFRVAYTGLNPDFHDVRFDVKVLDARHYQLAYRLGNRDLTRAGLFGGTLEAGDFPFTLSLNGRYDPTVSDGDFYFVVNSPGALNDYVSKNIRVSVVNPSARLLQVAFFDHNPVKARDLVQAIDSVYLLTTLGNKNKANVQRIAYLQAQMRLTEDTLEQYERRMQQFVIANRSAATEMNLAQDLGKIEETLEKRLVVNAKVGYLRTLETLLRSNQDTRRFVPVLGKELDPQLVAVVNAVNQLQQERALMLASLKETTLAATAKDEALALARRSALEIIGQEQRLLQTEVATYSDRIGQWEQAMVNKPAQTTAYTKLKRTHGLYEEYYLEMMRRKAEIGIAGAGTVAEFVVLSPASLPKMPVSPNRPLIYAGSGAVGVVLSLVAVVLLYFLNNTITSQRELEKISLAPVLGIVPTYPDRAVSEGSRLVIDKNPKSATSEALRLIRTNLDFVFSPRKTKRLISVTSTVSGEGKTFVAINLGGIIALSDARVVLLDLDMRRPKVHVAFDADNQRGISTILINKHRLEECIQRTAIPTLDFIASGPTPPNPSELILRPEFDRLLEELTLRYDYIIIDTPPVGLVTDGLLVMGKVDLPLYVVRADYSRRAVVNNINRLVRNERFRNMKLILNAFRSEKELYKYDYGRQGHAYYEEVAQKSTPLRRLEKILLRR